VPELEKEEQQTELGWEDISAHDDGTRDYGEPEPKPDQQTAETAPEQQTEQQPEPTQEPVEPTAEGAQETEPSPEETVFTLPGGKKVTREELIADEKLLANLVTHSNQLTHFQKLSEQRKADLEARDQELRAMRDRWTDFQMQQQMQQQAPQQPPMERPPTKQLEAHYAPVLDRMVETGRLTEDHRSEFGGIISEQLFENQRLENMLINAVSLGASEIQNIQGTLTGQVQPTLQTFEQQNVSAAERAVQQEASQIPGYEALAQPEEWNRLLEFVGQKIQHFGFDHAGNPLFNPNLDAVTAAQMYDAMTANELRAQVAAQAAAQAAKDQDQQTMAAVSGETSARAGSPRQKQPSKMTPEEEAMDFSDPKMMTG
jgi:hypothetical protein